MKLSCAVALILAGIVRGQTTQVPLSPTAGLKLVGTSVEQASYKGKQALRVTYESGEDGGSLVILPKIDFQDGVIEFDFAGDVKPGSPPLARGFTGLAFRVSPDGQKYECFYARPLNSKSQDAQQRMHAVQYISMPGYGWRKLRTEFPGKFENSADLTPGEWAHARIEVRGKTATLYLNSSAQPALTVDELKQGVSRGTLALWVDVGTVAHFANLRVHRE